MNRTRRQILGDSHNHERWLVSYSDFMTLLFGFFVVMYAISSVNEGKYKILSDALTEVFNERAALTLTPIQVGEPARSSSPSAIDFEQIAAAERKTDVALEMLGQSLGERLATKLDASSFTVNGNDQWLEVNVDADVLFRSGSAELAPVAQDVIGEVVNLLTGLSNPVTVEGYTDNVPIANARFPSNWELSAARASAVARLFAARGIEPARLAAVGYGENHPIATNATPEGRARNRRVTLIVPQNADVQRGLTAIGADRSTPIGMQWSNEDEPAPTDSADASTGEAVHAIRRKSGGVLFTNEPAPPNGTPEGQPTPSVP